MFKVVCGFSVLSTTLLHLVFRRFAIIMGLCFANGGHEAAFDASKLQAFHADFHASADISVSFVKPYGLAR